MSRSEQPQRGLGFAFFTVLLALLSWYTTTPERSFIGRTAGGLFVWALSIPDAYKIARISTRLDGDAILPICDGRVPERDGAHHSPIVSPAIPVPAITFLTTSARSRGIFPSSLYRATIVSFRLIWGPGSRAVTRPLVETCDSANKQVS